MRGWSAATAPLTSGLCRGPTSMRGQGKSRRLRRRGERRCGHCSTMRTVRCVAAHGQMWCRGLSLGRGTRAQQRAVAKAIRAESVKWRPAEAWDVGDRREKALHKLRDGNNVSAGD